MNYFLTSKFSKSWSQLAIACSVSLNGLWLNSCAIAVTANRENLDYVSQNQAITASSLNFKLPSRRSPGHRKMGASYGNLEYIVALIPSTNFGYTTEKNPRLWVYFPYKTQEQVRFTLKGEEDEQIYQQEFALSGNPGFVELILPETVDLEVIRTYFWEFEVGLETYGDLDNPIIRGAIERVMTDNSLKDQLAGKSEHERLEVYAKNGFWFDILSGLIGLRKTNPEDEKIASLWANLLQQIGLGELKDKLLLL